MRKRQFIIFAVILAVAGIAVACRDSRLNKPSFAVLPEHPNASAFVGDWWDAESHSISYQVFHRGDGKVLIQIPANDIWWSEFRNIRFEGQSLRFDLYNYTPRNSTLRTAANSQGEHPFSGVRCDTRLEIDRSDTNRIEQTMRTVHTTNDIKGILVRKAKN